MSIEEIEQELFLLDMKDHFTHEDIKRREELLKMLGEQQNEHSGNI